jgi:hypothetical protein
MPETLRRIKCLVARFRSFVDGSEIRSRFNQYQITELQRIMATALSQKLSRLVPGVQSSPLNRHRNSPIG